MRKFLMTFILFFISSLYSQNSENDLEMNSSHYFFEIKIRSGYTSYGTQSISFMREGLVYWKCFSLKDSNEEGKYIPFRELDIDRISKIMEYIRDQKLYDIKKLDIPEGTVIPTDNPFVISFVAVNGNKYNSFSYSVCDENIDYLIQMINELIPKEDREEFGIKLRCNYKR